jgi:hypothetical protein
MSNYLAIATVTASLRELLQDATINDHIDGVHVTTRRPDATANASLDPKINIYLYQVTPNAAYRNADIPTRRSDGTFVQSPQVALDLHYMISFYGDEDQLLTQRMLGSVVRTLHAYPVLTRDRIRNTINPAQISGSTGSPGDTFPYLAASNLADQVELVKFSPLHLSLEELSKIWSIFFQIPYSLSVAYQGSVVLIQSDDQPRDVLPVRRRNIYIMPFHQPVIEKISISEGPERDAQPVSAESTLYISGKNLKGDVTLVRVGGIEVAPLPDNISNARIVLPLANVEQSQVTQSPTHLQAGVLGIQVVQPMLMGMDTADKPLEAHHGVESNVVAFVLRPIITGQPAAGSGEITVTVKPAAGKTQRAVLLLNEISPNPGQSLDHPARFYRSDQRIIKANDADPNNTLTFSVANISAGTYLVRVQIDGAESLLDLSPETDSRSPLFNTYSGSPRVTIA